MIPTDWPYGARTSTDLYTGTRPQASKKRGEASRAWTTPVAYEEANSVGKNAGKKQEDDTLRKLSGIGEDVAPSASLKEFRSSEERPQ